jgi:hypothetical protein
MNYQKIRVFVLCMAIFLLFSGICYSEDNRDGGTFTVGETSVSKCTINQLCGYDGDNDFQELSAHVETILKSPLFPTFHQKYETWSWTGQNVLRPNIRFQGIRSTGWAFAMLEMLRFGYAIFTDRGYNFPVEEVIAANPAGSVSLALDMIKKEGISDELSGRNCKIANWGFIKGGEINTIKYLLRFHGPILAAVHVDKDFLNYTEGIFNGNKQGKINHIVLLMGWDDTNGTWLIQNSWGSDWGENGYMRIKYGCQRIGEIVVYAAFTGWPHGLAPLHPGFVPKDAEVSPGKEISAISGIKESTTPGDEIVAIAVYEEGRGPNEVGQDLGYYPYDLGRYLDPGEAWCSEFVSWVYKVAGYPLTGGSEGGWMLVSSYVLKDWYQARGLWIQKGTSEWETYIPQAGDYLRYQFATDGHSGIVRYMSGSTLYSVEGNVSNIVQLRSRSDWRNYSSFDGIGYRILGNIVGNTEVYSSTSTSANRRAMPFTMPENGTINSVTMYHEAGSGRMILAVYDGTGTPQNRLGVTPETNVSSTSGWQTINLTSPVFVANGTTIWLAWVYESNPGIAYETGTPGRVDAGVGWSGGMPDPFGSGTQANYLYSIHAAYTPGSGPTQYTLTTDTVGQGSITLDPPGGTYDQGTVVTLTAQPASGWQFYGWSGDLSGSENPDTITMNTNKSVTASFVEIGDTVGNTQVFSSTSTSANRRAMPFTMPESGTIESVTMYHYGGSGSMILAVYDGEGSPQNRLGVTAATPVSSSTGWQTINLTSSAYVSGGSTVWLAWVYESNPGIAYQTGSPGRVDAGVGWSGGMPDPFGSSTQANYLYSIYATYTSGVGIFTVGNTQVFGSTSTTPNRRAMPFTMPEDGTIDSVTMYHEGGSGSMILAVYAGTGLPQNRLGVTAITTVNSSAGWQTINLTSSAYVSGGSTVWLAWVYESIPGVRYETGSPGRAQSGDLWAGGMPDPFGSSSQSDFIYSIYATYTIQ